MLIILVIFGLIYRISWEKNQEQKNEPLQWFSSEQAAINNEKEGLIAGRLTLLRGTNYINGKKAIPAYFKNRKNGEGFIIIELAKKEGRYALILNNAGASVSYPPGLSEGAEVVPGLIFNLDREHRYILYFGKNKRKSNQITLKSNKIITPRYVKNTDIYYKLAGY